MISLSNYLKEKEMRKEVSIVLTYTLERDTEDKKDLVDVFKAMLRDMGFKDNEEDQSTFRLPNFRGEIIVERIINEIEDWIEEYYDYLSKMERAHITVYIPSVHTQNENNFPIIERRRLF